MFQAHKIKEARQAASCVTVARCFADSRDAIYMIRPRRTSYPPTITANTDLLKFSRLPFRIRFLRISGSPVDPPNMSRSKARPAFIQPAAASSLAAFLCDCVSCLAFERSPCTSVTDLLRAKSCVERKTEGASWPLPKGATRNNQTARRAFRARRSARRRARRLISLGFS
jgi:hypothetical protein